MDGTHLIERLSSVVERRELDTIAELMLIERLRRFASHGGGVKQFGRLFHPIRHSFVHVNFIVGAREEMHEIFWSGLARNLFEESGGGVTPAHNELYRQFLRSIGIPSDKGIEEVEFSRVFNMRWRELARSAPVEEAVLAIAIYEILDRPDYLSLYHALKGLDESWNIEFFRLHSAVEHFDMFSEFVAWFYDNIDRADKCFERASDFVLATQKDMWLGLLAAMGEACSRDLGKVDARHEVQLLRV